MIAGRLNPALRPGAVTAEPDRDRAALASLRAGEPRALNALVERWQGPLLRFAYRYSQNVADAQDLVAEAFFRLYRSRARLRPDTNLPAWLFTTLANLCRNHHRWKRRHPTVALDEQWPGSVGDPSPEAAIDESERIAALRAEIDALPHDLKTALLLHHYERLSYREIADIVGCSARGVETRLYRARRLLRTSLERSHD